MCTMFFPSGPLREYIRRHYEYAGINLGLNNYHGIEPTHNNTVLTDKIRSFGKPTTSFESVHMAVKRLLGNDFRMRWDTVDEFCVGLGVHPYYIYGDEWLVPEDELERVAV